MKYSRHAKVALAVALAVTVPLKFLFRPVSAAEAQQPELTIAAFLARHGYQPLVEQRPAGPYIYATAGACHLLVRLVPFDGWNLDSIKLSARTVGPLVFVFNGAVDASPPMTAALVYYYKGRVREWLHFNPSSFPLLAVAASDGCAVESLPWKEVAEIS